MITRLKLSTIEQGLPKYRSMLAGNDAYIPNSFESIATATGTGSSATITFSSIPSTYQHLQIRFIGLTTAASDISLQIPTGSALAYTHYLYGDGATAGANATAGTTYMTWAAQPSSTLPFVGIIDIHDYASTTKTKTVRFFNGIDKNGSGDVILGSALRNSTSAISSISLLCPSSTWTTSSTFALYGVKGA